MYYIEIESENGDIATANPSSDEGDTGNKRRRRLPPPEKPKRSVSDFIPQENTGTIHVGIKHQAVLPTLQGPSYKSKVRPMVKVWTPNTTKDSISDDEIDTYLQKATNILRNYISKKNIKGCILQVPASPIFLNEDFEEVKPEDIRTPYPHLRESCQTKLLTNLYENNLNTLRALTEVQANPSIYLSNLWTKSEQHTFHALFRQYCGALRLIQKQMSHKSHQEVIDYFYRFKIPNQFRKFQEKKREAALDTVKRVGVKMDAVESRRGDARELLSQVKRVLGEETYLELGGVMKEYHASLRDGGSGDGAVKLLKSRVCGLLDGHDQLFRHFLLFLPSHCR